jgi:uncharacterized membrane protein
MNKPLWIFFGAIFVGLIILILKISLQSFKNKKMTFKIFKEGLFIYDLLSGCFIAMIVIMLVVFFPTIVIGIIVLCVGVLAVIGGSTIGILNYKSDLQVNNTQDNELTNNDKKAWKKTQTKEIIYHVLLYDGVGLIVAGLIGLVL